MSPDTVAALALVLAALGVVGVALVAMLLERDGTPAAPQEDWEQHLATVVRDPGAPLHDDDARARIPRQRGVSR